MLWRPNSILGAAGADLQRKICSLNRWLTFLSTISLLFRVNETLDVTITSIKTSLKNGRVGSYLHILSILSKEKKQLFSSVTMNLTELGGAVEGGEGGLQTPNIGVFPTLTFDHGDTKLPVSQIPCQARRRSIT